MTDTVIAPKTKVSRDARDIAALQIALMLKIPGRNCKACRRLSKDRNAPSAPIFSLTGGRRMCDFSSMSAKKITSITKQPHAALSKRERQIMDILYRLG